MFHIFKWLNLFCSKIIRSSWTAVSKLEICRPKIQGQFNLLQLIDEKVWEFEKLVLYVAVQTRLSEVFGQISLQKIGTLDNQVWTVLKSELLKNIVYRHLGWHWMIQIYILFTFCFKLSKLATLLNIKFMHLPIHNFNWNVGKMCTLQRYLKLNFISFFESFKNFFLNCIQDDEKHHFLSKQISRFK